MPRRYYSNAAVPTSLSGTITAGATSMTVAAVTGFPTVFPYTLTLDKNQTGLGEAVEVTAAAGTTLTIVRGVDGTTAQGHNAGALVSHDHTARDYAEWQQIRDHQIMNPGNSSLNLRRGSSIAAVAANTSYSLLTVPANRQYVVKNVVVTNTAAADTTAGLIIGSGTQPLSLSSVLKGNAQRHQDMALVMNPGESLNLQAGVGGSVVLATATYSDMIMTDAPTRMADGSTLAANTWTTVYTAPGPMVVTYMSFANNSAAIAQYGYRVGTGNPITNINDVAIGDTHVIDSVFYMAAAEVLQVRNTLASSIHYTFSGLAVTT